MALQNLRNADALNSNLKAFFEAEEAFFKAAIEGQLIDEYRDVVRAIQDNDRPNQADVTKIAAYYESEAKKLRDAVKNLTDKAKAIEVARYQAERPLTAAVAFGDMLPKVAAGKWIGFEAIHLQSTASREGKFGLIRKHFRDLPVLERKEEAVKDLLRAYAERTVVLLQQGANAKEIASQLVAASNASYDASKFLQGVLENNDIIKSIAEYVLKTTGNPDRKKAAEELLKSLSDGSKK